MKSSIQAAMTGVCPHHPKSDFLSIRAAVYVDGRLNTGAWNGETGNKLALPVDGRFGLLSHQGMDRGSINEE
jgi:hypothetical protein